MSQCTSSNTLPSNPLSPLRLNPFFLMPRFAFVGSANVKVLETLSSTSGGNFQFDLDDALKADATSCCAELSPDEQSFSALCVDGTRRRLGDNGFPPNGSMLDVFSLKPGIPATLIAMAIFISVGWIVLLRAFATPIVFVTEAIKIACIVFIALKTDDESATPVFLIIAVLYTLLVIWKRDKLKFAGKVISHSAMALQKNPGMFGGLLGIKALYCLQAFCFVLFVSKSVEVMEVAREEVVLTDMTLQSDCVLQTAGWVSTARSIVMFCWLWSIMWYTQARLGVVAMIIGSWHFHPEDMPSVSTAVGAVFTTSLGTISFSALLLAIIERIKKSLKFKWYHHCGPQVFVTLPFACLATVVLWCFETCFKMLTKFTLILHVFSGLNFFGSAKKCFGLLTRHFEGALVTEVTSRAVLTLGAYVFSIAISFSCWAWIDTEFGWNSLSTASENDEGGSEALIRFFGWFFLMMFNLWYPTLGIFCMIMLDMLLQNLNVGYQEYWVAPFAAIFVGVIAMLFFTYTAGVILDTIDVCFVCWAVDKDNNVDLSESEFAVLICELPGLKKEPNPAYGNTDGLLAIDPSTGQFAQPSAPPAVVQGQYAANPPQYSQPRV